MELRRELEKKDVTDMGVIIAGALLPHPPIMVPEIGQEDVEKVRKTVNAARQVATYINKYKPDTIIIISPHGPMFRNAVGISRIPALCGNFSRFGAPETALEFANDCKLALRIGGQCEKKGIPVVNIDEESAQRYRLSVELDHGALVPLYYLRDAGFKGEIVYLSVGMLEYRQMEMFGVAVQEAVRLSVKRVVVVASGDLSHRLDAGAPNGYSPRGKEFDELVLTAVRDNSLHLLHRLSPELVEEAGQCGLRPIFFLLGALAGIKTKVELLSYEAPFGVGYAVAIYKPFLDAKGGAV